jgi:hypothetical protein
MDVMCGTYVKEEKYTHRFLVGKLEGVRPFVGQGVYRKIILKMILNRIE